MHDVEVVGADPEALGRLRTTGLDHGGNPVEPFVDDEGGWPLRCCLTDSLPGDRIAVVAWSPFPWRGPFAEVGPVVIHAEPCPGPAGDALPVQFLARDQLVRPYGHDQRIVYDAAAIVPGDGTLEDVLAGLLDRPDVAFVVARNVLAGCYSFTARRRRSA